MSFDPTQRFYLILLSDPAIDHSKSNIDKYINTRDPDFIVCKPDQQPTKYYFDPIDHRAIDLLDAIYKQDNVRHKQAFSVAIRAIETATQVFEPELDVTKVNQFTAQSAPLEWVDAVRDEIGDDAVERLGQIVYDLAKGAKTSTPFSGGLSLRGGRVRKTSNS